jgi:hypothetical protein
VERAENAYRNGAPVLSFAALLNWVLCLPAFPKGLAHDTNILSTNRSLLQQIAARHTLQRHT